MPHFEDALWGTIRLDEPVLAELVDTEPVQRLRHIHQAGASYYLFPWKKTTRFDHSLGVVHVLSALGASLDERIAGLLHDVPHTAFSHTVDIVFPSDEHNFHERFQHDIVMRSAIPHVLGQHSIDMRAALEPDRFPLLEQPLPDLCADRLDYSLRDLHQAGIITAPQARGFLGRLIPTPAGIMVDNTEAARWYAKVFLQANDTLWTGPQEAGSYWVLAQAIKRAFKIGAFTDQDLFSTDDAAMRKLASTTDTAINALLALLKPGTEFHEVENDGPYFTTHMKQRAVDPQVWEPGWRGPIRLSELSSEYSALLRGKYASRTEYYRLWSPSLTEELLRIAQK